ncbi:MAG: hypothetical protein KAS04_04090 [Candidatus Aenigmarchaeota archaeon]|nr:hypothetical protein [Candidatus Aenigmarchaeota archaeon]
MSKEKEKAFKSALNFLNREDEECREIGMAHIDDFGGSPGYLVRYVELTGGSPCNLFFHYEKEG